MPGWDHLPQSDASKMNFGSSRWWGPRRRGRTSGCGQGIRRRSCRPAELVTPAGRMVRRRAHEALSRGADGRGDAPRTRPGGLAVRSLELASVKPPADSISSAVASASGGDPAPRRAACHRCGTSMRHPAGHWTQGRSGSASAPRSRPVSGTPAEPARLAIAPSGQGFGCAAHAATVAGLPPGGRAGMKQDDSLRLQSTWSLAGAGCQENRKVDGCPLARAKEQSLVLCGSKPQPQIAGSGLSDETVLSCPPC